MWKRETELCQDTDRTMEEVGIECMGRRTDSRTEGWRNEKSDKRRVRTMHSVP